MEDKDFTRLVDNLKEAITLQVQEQVYEQTKNKDKEISSLHREINKKLGEQGELMIELKDIVKNHDEVIIELRQLYKTSGYIKKFILWFLLFVPSIAGFFAGLRYLYDLIKH